MTVDEEDLTSEFSHRRASFLKSIFIDLSVPMEGNDNADSQLSLEELLASAFHFPDE